MIRPTDIDRIDATDLVRNSKNRMTVRVFTCDKCGHVQTFHFPPDKPPGLWQEPG